MRFGSRCSCSLEGARCQMVTAGTIRPELRVRHLWGGTKRLLMVKLHAACHW